VTGRREDILSTNTSTATNTQTDATAVITISSMVIPGCDGSPGEDRPPRGNGRDGQDAATARPWGAASHARHRPAGRAGGTAVSVSRWST